MSAGLALGPHGSTPALHVLVLSVPADLHEFRGVLIADASARLGEWSGRSVGVVQVRTPSHLVVAFLDVAGRKDLTQLERAADGSGVYAMPVAADETDTPLVRICGFRDMLAEAATLRRLTAREFTEAVAGLREELRGPRSLAALPPLIPRFKSVSVNVCMPL